MFFEITDPSEGVRVAVRLGAMENRRRLADGSGRDGERLHLRAAAVGFGVCHVSQDEQPRLHGVGERARDPHLLPRREPEVVGRADVDATGVVLNGEALIEHAGAERAGRDGDGAVHRDDGAERQAARFGNRDGLGIWSIRSRGRRRTAGSGLREVGEEDQREQRGREEGAAVVSVGHELFSSMKLARRGTSGERLEAGGLPGRLAKSGSGGCPMIVSESSAPTGRAAAHAAARLRAARLIVLVVHRQSSRS